MDKPETHQDKSEPKETKKSPSALAPQKKFQDRALEREKQERDEVLSQIEEGLSILAEDQPLLQIDVLGLKLEKCSTPMLTQFAKTIFDLYDLTPEGVKTFNQLVETDQTNELISRVSSSVYLINRCRDVYHAPQEVVDAAMSSLQNLEKSPLINCIQAKPGVLRLSIRLSGKFYTWDTGGTVNSPVKEVPEKPKVVVEPTHEFTEEVMKAFAAEVFKGSEDDTVEERLARVKRLLTEAVLSEAGTQHLISDQVIENIQDSFANLDFIWEREGEKEEVMNMSPDELRNYLAYEFFPRMAEKSPKSLMAVKL